MEADRVQKARDEHNRELAEHNRATAEHSRAVADWEQVRDAEVDEALPSLPEPSYPASLRPAEAERAYQLRLQAAEDRQAERASMRASFSYGASTSEQRVLTAKAQRDDLVRKRDSLKAELRPTATPRPQRELKAVPGLIGAWIFYSFLGSFLVGLPTLAIADWGGMPEEWARYIKSADQSSAASFLAVGASASLIGLFWLGRALKHRMKANRSVRKRLAAYEQRKRERLPDLAAKLAIAEQDVKRLASKVAEHDLR